MHKGLLWTQLFLGIGIGLTIGALIWIFYPQIFPDHQAYTVVPPAETIDYSSADLDTEVTELISGEPSEEEPPQEGIVFNEEELINEKIMKEEITEFFTLDDLLITDTEDISTEEYSEIEEDFVNQREPENIFLDGNSLQDNTTYFEEGSTYPSDKLLSDFDENLTDEFIEITVEPGDSAETIARKLKDKGIITYEEEFLKIVREKRVDRKLRAGNYLLTEDTSMIDFVKKLLR